MPDTTQEEPIVLGLGSNLGNRRAAIETAVSRIQECGVGEIRLSSWYETSPVGPEQPWFLNRVLVGRTRLDPGALLDVALAIERELGRERSDHRWGPRVIDIDLLCVGEHQLESERLRLPHREIAARRFVLVPWAELEPDRIIPGTGRSVSDCLAALEASGDESQVVAVEEGCA